MNPRTESSAARPASSSSVSVMAARMGAALRDHFDHFVERLPAEELVEALGRSFHRRRVHDLLRRRLEREMLVRMRQRVVRHQRSDVAELGGFRFQKLPPRRNAVEKIGDADRRAHRQARGLHADQLAAGKFDPRAVLFLGGARLQQQARDRGHRRQRFSAKAQRGNRKQVVGGAQLRGGVPLECQQRVVVRHAATVVGDADHALAAGFDLDAHRSGAGIQRVFEQLLHHRGGPLDHFSGGDPVGHCFRQYADAAQRSTPV